jgi:hypothetical protein
MFRKFFREKSFIKDVREWMIKEFKEEPIKIKYKKTYKRLMMGKAFRVELLYYIMKNGDKGRVLFSPIIKSFSDIEAKNVTDDDLIYAYGGWLFLSGGIKDGFIKTSFKSKRQETKYLEIKKGMGLEEIEVLKKYKIGTSEIFEISGRLGSLDVLCAGNEEVDVCFDETNANFYLPTIYFLLGEQVFKGGEYE